MWTQTSDKLLLKYHPCIIVKWKPYGYFGLLESVELWLIFDKT